MLLPFKPFDSSVVDERLVTLLATQVARVQFPVPARPTLRVEKVAHFFNPVSRGTFSSTAIEIINGLTNLQ
jgi:hypothetical protein